jgi:hypothetical protein
MEDDHMTTLALRAPLLFETFTSATFKPRLTVQYESTGLPVDLTANSGTATCKLGNKAGATVSPASYDNAGKPSGLVVALFNIDTIAEGDWEMQWTVVMLGETQVVARDVVRVRKSV